ncbi:MAG: bacillithiol system redox-active protein YtxJ [Luteibaculaceae bacterium]
MGIFSFLSGPDKQAGKENTNGSSVPWITLTKEEQLDALEAESEDIPVLIFKHSTRCGISSMAKRRIEREWPFANDEVKIYYLDLLNYRSISNQIVKKWDVEHQSPQLIGLKNRKVFYHDSHDSIDVAGLKTN